jgi:prepilin-type N-terminal cleavage/methylation domain-containing protein
MTISLPLGSRRRSGFTFIELMLAMSLGVILMYALFAGMRTAAQSIAISNRLALENSLLRSAYLLALDEVDFWATYDDPNDSSTSIPGIGCVNGGEGLRNPGLPFSPFYQTSFAPSAANESAAVRGSETPYAFPNEAVSPPTDGTRGWTATYPWSMCDPLVWARINLAESGLSDLRFGFYSMFSNISTSPSLGSAATFAFGSPTVNHTWLSNQMDGLKKQIGYYGMIDYLPSNTIYAYATPRTNATNDDGLLTEFIGPGDLGNGPGYFKNGDGVTQFAQGLYRATKDSSFSFAPLKGFISTALAPNGYMGAWNSYYSLNRSKFNTNQYATAGIGGTMQQFLDCSMSTLPLMAVKPSAWPNFDISVMRYITANRFATVCCIRWVNPLTGEVKQLNFNGFGTTLRGARQQRKRVAGSGWASWDDDGMDHSADTNFQNLDTY